MMQLRKKIFDIVPPQKKEEPQTVIFPEVSETKQEKKPQSILGSRKFSKRGIGIFAALALISFLVFGIYARFLEARVTIRPVMEKWDFQEEVLVSVASQSINVPEKTIPGFFVQESKELSQQFPATGKTTKAAKAQGTIRVYNKYQLPQVLIANTRFLSDEGRLFRSKSRVSIAPGTYQDVSVEAAEPGEAYNIGPSTFSIPGLAGSPRYTAVYGESQEPMTGGSVSDAPQVTEDDIKKAKDALSATLLQEGKKELLAKIQGRGDDTILLEGAFSQDLESIESLVGRGAQVSNFQVTGKLNSKAIVFQRKDIEEFWKQFSSSQLSPEKIISPESFQTKFSFKSIDWEQGRIILQSSASAFAYFKLDLRSIQERLRGISTKKGKEFLKTLPSVAEAEVKLWPLPLGNIPRDPNKIKIFLELNSK